MLFAGHSGTGSCPVFGVGKAVLLPLIRSLKSRSWRTALHARRKENVFDKWIFSFQGSKEKRCSRFGGRKIKTHRGKNTLHYTRHFSAIYKRGKGICLQIVYI